jgi:hypothetical protein
MLQSNLTYPIEGTLLSAAIGQTRTVYEINYVSNHAGDTRSTSVSQPPITAVEVV